jgi:hypothetical protein
MSSKRRAGKAKKLLHSANLILQTIRHARQLKSLQLAEKKEQAPAPARRLPQWLERVQARRTRLKTCGFLPD